VCASNRVTSIYGTPSNPENYARLIRQRVDKCTGGQKDQEAESEE